MNRGNLPRDGLLKEAAKDFELAKKYKDGKELITASLLYNRATEMVLKALFIKKTRRQPPEKASIAYLAMKAKLPDEISSELFTMEQDEMSDVMEEELEMERSEGYRVSTDSEYNNVLSKGNVVGRLISYAEANK